MSTSAKVLCFTLATRFRGKDPSEGAFPSQELLARETGYSSTRTIRKARDEARAAGFISSEKTGPRKIVYRPTFPVGVLQLGSANEVANDTEENSFGQAAQLIREHWWQGPTSPETDWTMGNERTIWEHFAEIHGPEIVNTAIPLVRDHFKMDGKPFTGRLVNSRKTRTRWNECLARAEQILVQDDAAAESSPNGRSVGQVLEEVEL